MLTERARPPARGRWVGWCGRHRARLGLTQAAAGRPEAAAGRPEAAAAGSAMDGDAGDTSAGIPWVRVGLGADRSTVGIGAADSAIGHIQGRPYDASNVGGIPEGPHRGLMVAPAVTGPETVMTTPGASSTEVALIRRDPGLAARVAATCRSASAPSAGLGPGAWACHRRAWACHRPRRGRRRRGPWRWPPSPAAW
jgi:hypothetical protein